VFDPLEPCLYLILIPRCYQLCDEARIVGLLGRENGSMTYSAIFIQITTVTVMQEDERHFDI